MEICNLSLHPDSAKSRKIVEQKFIFHINTLNPHGINKRFSFKYFILVFLVTMFPPVALLHFPHINLMASSSRRGDGQRISVGGLLSGSIRFDETSALELFTVAFTFSTQFLTLNYPI